MATYIIRDVPVTVHAHPHAARHFMGTPVSVQVDGLHKQVLAASVTIANGPFEVEETVTFDAERLEYDPEDGVANIVIG